jgi:DNA-directed RNA polymerase specialized sigma24 family protein
MRTEPDSTAVSTQPAPWFATTHWSVVLTAGDSSAPGARAALERLCRTYWYSLYAYIRRKGRSPQDAQDLTQAFLASLLARHDFARAQPAKGKFRSFLLAALNHFLCDDWDKARAAKRGGGRSPLSLDETTSEGRYRLEPVDEMSAEKIFERRWALTLLEQARARLGQEYEAAGKAELYKRIRVFEAGDKGPACAEVAAALGIGESTLRSHIFRLRRRFAQLVREEIAHTVSTPAEVEDEIRHLLSVIAQ